MSSRLRNPFLSDEQAKMGQFGSTVASATNINLEDATGEVVRISGTTTIAGIQLGEGHKRLLYFTGALQITYGATTIVTPGAVSLLVNAGDWVEVIGDAASLVRVIRVVRSVSAQVAAATTTLTAADSGKVIFLDHATEFVTTLPAVALGLRFTFVLANAPESASFTIVTAASANVIKGQVYTLDVNSATDPDFETSGGDTITFVDAKAVAGDSVDLFCDGTNWFARCFCSVFDAITITTAS